MDYEKLHKDTIAKLQQMVNSGKITVEVARGICADFIPESEDERIRKHLIKHFGNKSKEDWNGVPVKSILAWFEKQGEQKSADKVEPKFHEGDWIIHQGTENLYQVVAVIDNQYQLKYGDNYTIQNCVDVDRCTRLWDITKDAKDGDVLEFGDHGRLVVGIVSYINKTTGKVDVNCLLENNNFKVGNYYNLDTIKPHPATKEQCDTLERAITNAGYRWNKEKLKLEKI